MCTLPEINNTTSDTRYMTDFENFSAAEELSRAMSASGVNKSLNYRMIEATAKQKRSHCLKAMTNTTKSSTKGAVTFRA